MKHITQRTLLIATILSLLTAATYTALATTEHIPGAINRGQNTAQTETPYGESLEINLNTGSKTTGEASWITKNTPWMASYTDSQTQNVYTVNGTYKSQEQVTLDYSLTVTHANIENIQATVKIKAYDSGNPSTNTHEYNLATGETLTGSSPITDTGSTTASITQHLTDIGGSTTSITTGYDIYCQVTATGTISGDTLTASIPYTHFGGLTYQQTSESSDASVTPTISVASYYDTALGVPQGTIIWAMAAFTATLTLAYLIGETRQ